METEFATYRQGYIEYYESCKHPNSPAMRDLSPVVILIPTIGMFTFTKDNTTARLASEYYINVVLRLFLNIQPPPLVKKH